MNFQKPSNHYQNQPKTKTKSKQNLLTKTNEKKICFKMPHVNKKISLA